MRILSLLLLAAATAYGAELRIGRAAVKITPRPGAPMGSSYGLESSIGVHDDLWAKALLLEVDGARAAMVSCDLISMPPRVVAAARKLIAQATGLTGDRIILSATHCHAGPQMNPLFLALVDPAARQLAEQYTAALPGLIAEAVRTAAANLEPARISAAVENEPSLSFNRRYLMRDGRVRMNPRRGDPNIVRAAGPIDPAVSVVYFESAKAQPLATFVNFALHVAIAGGNQISSDYPGVLAGALRQVKGPEMLTIFTNGMSGNVNHLDASWADQPRGAAESARVGTILAADVLHAYRHLKAVSPGTLQVRTVPVELETPKFDAADIEQAKSILARYGKPGAPPFLEIVNAWKVLDVAALRGRPLQTEVQAIAIGREIAWVGMPGDAFVELGLRIRNASPFPFTIITEQAGAGAISYVPDRRAFPQGDYEVISARFNAGGGEKLAGAAEQLLLELFDHAAR